MNNWFNHLVIFNGYPLAVTVAVCLHVVILVALLYLQGGNRVEAMELVQPTVVTALFIDENPQVRNQRVIEQRRAQQQADQRRAEEAARREREEAERRAAEEAARQQEQARQEAERQQAALREREELERQQRLQAEREQRERELREAEQRRQQELAAAEERRRQEEAERARQAAEAQAAAARNEFELVQSATGLIQQIVQENWSRPPSARNGMRAVIRIQMLPTGELLNATVIESSGDPAFDRSAETAVHRAAPFTELQDMPINVFNNNFRTLSLIFEPTDLLN